MHDVARMGRIHDIAGLISHPTSGGAFMKSILDPSFRYVPSTQTDVRKTFARERRRLRGEQEYQSPPLSNAVTIVARRKLFA